MQPAANQMVRVICIWRNKAGQGFKAWLKSFVAASIKRTALGFVPQAGHNPGYGGQALV